MNRVKSRTALVFGAALLVMWAIPFFGSLSHAQDNLAKLVGSFQWLFLALACFSYRSAPKSITFLLLGVSVVIGVVTMTLL